MHDRAGPTAAALARLHGPAAAARAPRTITPPVLLVRAAGRAALVPSDVVGVGRGATVGFIAAGFVFAIAGGVAALVAGALVVAVSVGVLVRQSGRSDQMLVSALPGTVDSVARSMRGGASLVQALGEASRDASGPLATELQKVLTEIDRGRPVGSAFQAWANRRALTEVRIVAAAFALASENEAAAVRALGTVANSLRDRMALSAEVRALTSQATASVQAMVLVPVVFLVIDGLAGQHALDFLTGDAIGRLCLAAGLGLELLGWVWMRMLIRQRLS